MKTSTIKTRPYTLAEVFKPTRLIYLINGDFRARYKYMFNVERHIFLFQHNRIKLLSKIIDESRLSFLESRLISFDEDSC